jgi:hypothetical protein
LLPSLTRWRTCRLQLLLVLVSSVILDSEPVGLMAIFYRLPQVQDGPVIKPGTGFVSLHLLRFVQLSGSVPQYRGHRKENYTEFTEKHCTYGERPFAVVQKARRFPRISTHLMMV